MDNNNESNDISNMNLNNLTINYANHIDISEINLNINKLTINEKSELNILKDNIKNLKYYINKTSLNRISSKLSLIIDTIYKQNKIYLERISFDPEKYSYNGEFDTFTKNKIILLIQIKTYLEHYNNVIESLQTDKKKWDIKVIYEALNNCDLAYSYILKII